MDSASDHVICSDCHEAVPYHVHSCPVCGADLGYPNVRAAEAPEERDALGRRYLDAKAHASAHNTALVLDTFEGVVFRSKAVLCRNWGVVSTLVSNDNELYATFHQRVWAEALLPSLNEFDQVRAAIDATFFPQHFEHIRFAALSLDDWGPSAYGACSIVLKDMAIAKRASVFDENTLLFCRKHRLIVGTLPPHGYRAWDFSNVFDNNGVQTHIYEPLTTNAAGTRTSFLRDIIPQNGISSFYHTMKSITHTPTSAARFTADFFNALNHANDVNPDPTTGLQDLSQQTNGPELYDFRRGFSGDTDRKLAVAWGALDFSRRRTGIKETELS